MRDLVGNVLAEGQLVLWRPAGLTEGSGVIGTILHIEEPNIATAGHDDRAAQIVIAVPVAVERPHGQSFDMTRLNDIVRIVDPKQQGVLEGILAGRGGKTQ